MNQNWR